MAESKRMFKTWGLFAGVVAVGAIALGVASNAAPSKKAQPPAQTPEEQVVAQKRVAAIGSTKVSRATQTPNAPTFPGGGVAGGAFTFITGFETTDSPSYSAAPLATGPAAGQNGWHIWNEMASPPSPAAAADTVSSVAATVSAANPATGVQHVRIQNDAGLADAVSVGAISSLLAPSAVAESSAIMDIYIAGAGDGQYNIRPRDTAGSDTVAVNVVFAPADMMIGQTLTTAGSTTVEIGEKNVGNNPLLPDICVLEEDMLNALIFKCIGDWEPAVYRCFEVSVSPAAGVVPTSIEYRYGVRDMLGVCPLIHSNDELVAADNVDSIHIRHNNLAAGTGFMDIDNLSIEINLIPGACCDGSMCSEVTSDQCSLANGDVFLGAGSECGGVAGGACAMGRCCAANGGCSFTAAGGCTGTFFGGYPADICDINCCEQPTAGGAECDDLTSIPTIPVPGVANFNGIASTADPVDCPVLVPDTEYHWEAFTITTCANVEISYCCSGEATGEVRSPAGNFIIQDSGPLGGCPCDDATVLFAPDDVNQGFGGGLTDKCADGNFHMLFVNLPPGTYYVPIFIQDNDPMAPDLVSPLEYQMQIETALCPIGGCCTGNTCTNTNVVACNAGGGNYLGDAVACTFACASGACCRPDGSCTNATTFASCVGAPMQPTTYFGGTMCATANGGVCPPANDRCGFAATLTDGTTPFSNAGALDDGAEDFCATSATTQDIWYNYTATCTGDVTISLCGFTPDFDSTLSVYTDTTCPIDTASRIACNDDFDCDNSGAPDGASWSEVTYAATMGQQVKVRLGSFQGGGESGAGEIIVSCAAAPMGCPCTTLVDCRNTACMDDNGCNHATCVSGFCVFTCERYGDVQPPGGNGVVNLDDILCILGGFANFANCPNADINPCGGNGVINLDDILAVLGAFSGANPCTCTENGTPGGGVVPVCGSSAP